MTTARRLDILRQLDKAPDGLFAKEVRGMTAWTARATIRALIAAGQVDELPVRHSEGRTSHRPVVRYVINAVGRSVLAGAEAGESFA